MPDYDALAAWAENTDPADLIDPSTVVTGPAAATAGRAILETAVGGPDELAQYLATIPVESSTTP